MRLRLQPPLRRESEREEAAATTDAAEESETDLPGFCNQGFLLLRYARSLFFVIPQRRLLHRLRFASVARARLADP
jgi:hypothetical protein